MTTRDLFAALAFASSISLAAPALAGPGKGVTQGAESKPKKGAKKAKKHAAWKNEKAVREHLAKHIKYPATKADILKACNDFSDVTGEDKSSFEAALPEGTYKSADEVVKALSM